jgi:DHA2 family multidrug resistance protein
MMNLFRNIGGSAGIAMVSTIFARRQQVHHQTLVSHLTPSDAGYLEMLQNTTSAIAAQGASLADAAVQAQGVLYGMVQKQAAMLAVNDAFAILGVIFLALIPLVVMLRKTEAPAGSHVMME